MTMADMRLVLEGELSLDAAKQQAKTAVLRGQATGVVTITDGSRTLYQCWGDGADFYELDYPIEESRRRSPRVPILIPVELEQEHTVLGARTADVSYHGALVLCASMCPPDSRLTVRNMENGGRATCRVVWIAAHEADASWAFKLGLEFDADLQPGFWGAEYQRRAHAV
jgi:PilZ domain